MRRAPRVLALLVGVSLSVRAADPPRSLLKLSFVHTGTPAAALEVTARDAKGRATTLRSDAQGEVLVPTDTGSLSIVDPATRVMLFEGAPSGAALAVPEPIRVSAEVRGARGAVEVRVGFGPRGSAAERWRRDTLRTMAAAHDEKMLGLALPPSPARFVGATLDQRRHVSEWIAAEKPQLVAFDAAGGVAVREVALPASLQPRATVDAGQITLEPSTGLDLQLASPGGDVANSFVAGLIDARFAPARSAEVAARLAILDQIDPALFEVLMFDLPMGLSLDGKLRLRGLPPLQSIEVRALEPLSGVTVARKVTLKPGAVTSLRLVAKGPLRSGRRGAFRGVVRELLGTPVAGATVVLSDFPERRETVSGADGSFRFGNVRRDRPVRLFVDATRSPLADHVRRTALFAAQKPEDGVTLALGYLPPSPSLDYAVPSPSPGFGDSPCRVSTNDDTMYPQWTGRVQVQNSWVPVDVQFGAVQFGGSQVRAQIWVPGAGTWQFEYSPTAFLYYYAQIEVTSPSPGPVIFTGTLNGAGNPANVNFQVRNPNNVAADGTQVLFSSQFDDLDPLEIDADGQGRFTVFCVNTGLWHVWAYKPGAAGGSCESDINLGGAGTTIFLKTNGGDCTP